VLTIEFNVHTSESLSSVVPLHSRELAGDWLALNSIDANQIEQSSDRIQLALMIASAALAQGLTERVRQHVLLAVQWGADRASVARILIATVHNTLGRAAAALPRQAGRALHHFYEAVSPCSAPTVRWIAVQARVQSQLVDIGPSDTVKSILGGGKITDDRTYFDAPIQLKELRIAAEHHETSLALFKEEHIRELGKLQRTITTRIEKEVANSTRQLEAYINLQMYFSSGQLTPQLHNWPISPDFGIFLIELINSNNYQAIIEFGSGSSTLLIARALRKKVQTQTNSLSGITATRQLAFEHLEKYHLQTSQLLASDEGLGHVDVALAPLVGQRTINNEEQPFYECEDILRNLSKCIGTTEETTILIIVDGPPAATGRLARLPALPIILKHFHGARLDFVLDDYARDEEREIVALWTDFLETEGIQPEITEKRLEKGACLIRVQS
jgi:hypothetical protein